MNYRITAALLITMMAPATAAESTLDRLTRLMTGTFESTGSEPPFVQRRIRIDAPAIGDHVFYLQINQGEDRQLYRQRILVARETADGGIEQRAFTIVEASRFVDAERSAMAGLTPEDIEAFLGEGCKQSWLAIESGFRGYVDPATCVITSRRTGKPRGIESEEILSEDGSMLAERGFDPDGNQLFGTPSGEHLALRRIPSQ